MRKQHIGAAVFALALSSAASAADEGSTVLWISPSAKVAEAAFLIERGDVQQGISVTMEALEEKLTFRDRAAAMNNLCSAKLALRQLRDAIEHCTQAVKIGNRFWQGYNNRGNAYYLMGDYEAAIRDYEQGLTIRPESGILKFNLRMAIDSQKRDAPPIVEEWES